MQSTTVDQILRDRELKNERNLAIARVIIFTIVTVADTLAYFDLIVFTTLPPTILTIILDLVFLTVGISFLLILLWNRYYTWLKFITITIDYLLITTVLILDPTIPKETETITWIALMGLLFIFFLNLIRHSVMAVIYAGILTYICFFSMILIIEGRLIAEMFPMSVSLGFMIFIGITVTRSNRKMMIEANTKKMMERYLAPQLVKELYKNQASLEPGGSEKEVTILFTDIRSFTTISEQESAQDVVSFLNGYLSTMTKIIFQNHGTLDKFIGDAIMTIFGAPQKVEYGIYYAIKTAVEMQRVIEKSAWNIKMGAGIHTGPVIAGNIGSEQRIDYTVIGDNVNLSSRIESLTKYYNCPILISEDSLKQLENSPYKKEFLIREIDTVVVKGRKGSITLYEVMCEKEDPDFTNLLVIKERYEEALKLYRSRDFKGAGAKFALIKTDKVSKLFKDRCERYMELPPDKHWSGIYEMSEK